METRDPAIRPTVSAANPRRRAIRLALFLTAVSFFLGLALRLHSMDDAFIAFRCARNLAHGHGLVYNPGEPVEAVSNFLYAALIGGAFVLLPTVDPTATARLLNHAGLFLILFLLFRNGGRAASPAERRWRELGGWWVGLHPAVWIYAHSGMETIFFTALLAGGFFLLLEAVEGRRSSVFAGLLFGLAADTRLEAAAFAGLAVVLVFALGPREGRLRRAALLAGAAAVVFLPVLAGRWLYYGYPFPNTYYVKVDGGSYDLALRGFKYDAIWLVQNPLALLALAASPVLFAAIPRWRKRAVLGWSFVLGYFSYCIFVGGDYFPYSRFLVPLLPVVGWLLGDQLALAAEWRRARRPGSKFLGRRLANGLLAAGLLWTLFYPRQLRQYADQMLWSTAWAAEGRAIKAATPPGLSLYVMTAGAIPYYSELIAHDSLGLSDPVLAHEKIPLGRGITGHEKMDLWRIDALSPDLILINGFGPGANIEHEINKARHQRHRVGSLLQLLFYRHFAEFYRPRILTAETTRILFLVKLSAIPLVQDQFKPLDFNFSP